MILRIRWREERCRETQRNRKLKNAILGGAMGAYTDFLEDRCFEILPSDDDYVGELARVTELFRSFDQALDSFLVDHGYTHDAANHENKVTYLASKFRMAGIDVPRNMKKWFTEHKKT